MTSDAASYDDEYEEYDEFDDDEDNDRGLSGLVVLLMGVVMLGAFASVVFIAYQQGIKTGENATTPYVTADPEPLKIENQTADAGDNVDREVYDRFNGEESNPVETIAASPEEPVARDNDDPIAAIAAQAENDPGVLDDAVADRIASLAAADEALDNNPPADEIVPDPVPTVQPTPVSTTPTPIVTAPASIAAGALSGSHLVQIGAFRSNDEATTTWAKIQSRLGAYANGKTIDVERADLGDRGVYHRLRIGPFANADAAKTYCQGLKDRGQDCLIKAK